MTPATAGPARSSLRGRSPPRVLAVLAAIAVASACTGTAPGPATPATGPRTDPGGVGAVREDLPLARSEALRAQQAPSFAEARPIWDAVARAGERALRASAPAFAAAVDRGEDPVSAAAAVGPAGAEPLYWLAVGRLRVAQATGPMAVMVTKDVILGLLERAAALDERVDRAGPHRWLGALRAALPAAAGGGVTRARAHFERARALAPEDPFRSVMEAETLAVLLQDAARFDALLAEVAARDPAAEAPLAAEITAAQRMAEALVARRAKLF